MRNALQENRRGIKNDALVKSRFLGTALQKVRSLPVSVK
jgi:hypothetical protein